MKNARAARLQRGFSFVETVVMLAVVGLLLAISVPNFLYLIRRNRLETTAAEVGLMVGRARMEAIKRGVPVVMQPDLEANQIVVFADINDDAGDPGSDLVFNPQDGAVSGTTDYVITRLDIPQANSFWAPGDNEPDGAASVEGFTELDGDEDAPHRAVLERDGTIRDIGAFHFGFPDPKDPTNPQRVNILQVLVSPAATARVQIRKYDPERTAGIDGTHFYIRGEDDQPWRWFE